MLGSNYDGGSAYVICVDVRDGSELWRVKTGKGADCAPALVGEVVLACEYEGAIRALDARSGELLWRRDLPEGTRSPVQILAHDEGITIADISGMIVHMGWPE
jgi:outer membrane protein assembly factor BamB